MYSKSSASFKVWTFSSVIRLAALQAITVSLKFLLRLGLVGGSA